MDYATEARKVADRARTMWTAATAGRYGQLATAYALLAILDRLNTLISSQQSTNREENDNAATP